MVGDTLSMPRGKGGYHKLSLNMDVFAQRLWVRPLTTATLGDTTMKMLTNVWGNFRRPETYMCDSGPEFDNWKLRKLCEESGVELHIVLKYSPWVNGLLEGMNSKLLGRLKRLCALGLGEDDYDKMQWEDLPENWPQHLEAAVFALNNRILPVLKFSPDELLDGLVNTAHTPVDEAMLPVNEADTGLQMAYMGQLRTDGYAEMVNHTVRCKA
jgi:transposase InsO family protein